MGLQNDLVEWPCESLFDACLYMMSNVKSLFRNGSPNRTLGDGRLGDSRDTGQRGNCEGMFESDIRVE
jgi:hypothetical protein